MTEFQKITIRYYDWKMDRDGVDDLLRRCEVGPSESFFLFTENLGDPISRIRNSPIYNMLLAELNGEIVGVIQGTIKLMTIRSKAPVNEHLGKVVGYILGLRVSPFHRRKGIALNLVNQMEKWFNTHHVDYAYMATEKDNEACTNLFINKLKYVKFRTPSILVNPVNRDFSLRLSSEVEIVRLKIQQAEFLYRKLMTSTEFFPHDIDRILNNKLSLGTWMAYFRRDQNSFSTEFGSNEVQDPKKSWAMLSVWKSSEVFKLRVGNPTLTCMLYSKSSALFPCFKSSFLPDFEYPFGFLFMYGIHHEGPKSGKLVRTLCKMVHNLATETDDCLKVIVTEVGCHDRLKREIPHWKLLSSPEDLWCIKDLKHEERLEHLDELIETPPETGAIFVDPREV